MLLRYDSGILYIKVQEGEVADTLELNPDTYLDVDSKGNVLAYEFWNGKDILELLKRGQEITVTTPELAHA
jgi:uncharacterized protein YuzE